MPHTSRENPLPPQQAHGSSVITRPRQGRLRQRRRNYERVPAIKSEPTSTDPYARWCGAGSLSLPATRSAPFFFLKVLCRHMCSPHSDQPGALWCDDEVGHDNILEVSITER